MVSAIDERPYTATPTIRRVSWAAIFAGLAVALAVQFLLSLIGIGAGAATVHPTSPNGASAQSVGTGSGIWFIVSSLISLFSGGWVAGRLAGMPREIDGVLHGLIAWSLTVLFTVYALSTAIGGVVSGATGALGGLFSAAGAGIAATAPAAAHSIQGQVQQSGITSNDVTSKVQQLLSETGNPRLSPQALKAEGAHQVNMAKGAAQQTALNPQASSQNTNELVYRFLHETGTTSQAADRTSLINVVAAQQHITKAQAAKTVDGWSQEAAQAQRQATAIGNDVTQKTKEAGDATASAISKAAFSGFILLLLGALAAAAGGYVSTRSLIAESRLIIPTTARL